MDREGGNRQRMRKSWEWISLHFLILSSFPRSPAARLQRFVQPYSQLNLSIKQFEPSKGTGWLPQVFRPSWNHWQLREMQTREKQFSFKMMSKESLVGINNALELRAFFSTQCFAINTQQHYNLQRCNRFAKGVVQHRLNKTRGKLCRSL